MKTFTIIWLGQVISILGSSLTGFGIGVWIFQQTGEPQSTHPAIGARDARRHWRCNMSILRAFMENHAHPKGLLGKLVAFRLGRVNRQPNEWVISLLDLKPTDRVLEIGFGPGLALQKIAAMVPQGWVAGIEPSEVMFQAAAKRNAAAIAAGRVELKLGDITALPYPDNHFDKGLAVQLINYLPEPLAGLIEWRRVMKPQGRIALFFEAPEKFERTRKMLKGIYRPYAGQEVIELVQQAGFARAWLEARQWWYGRGYCVLGEK